MTIGSVVFGPSKAINVTLDKPTTANVFSDGGSVTISSSVKATTVKIDQPTQTSISSPTLSGEGDLISVEQGGTGNTYLTMNAVLIGQGINPISTASSNVEGEVLTINQDGVPIFQMISGGTF